MRYYIVGYMYSGKTTFGRRLAEARGLDFLDTDQLFEQRFHYTVSDFFDRFGEDAFRQLESQILRSTANYDNVVIATGGGTPCYSDNMDFILSHGTAIYLRMSVDALLARALHTHRPRPAMRGLSPQQIEHKIISHLSVRSPYYLRSHIVLDSLTATPLDLP